ncbi:MAG: DUF4337 family protein [Caulobacteraceae bacterium]|nr:DUF4337 family protein [Caulobacteraceae bacterium]
MTDPAYDAHEHAEHAQHAAHENSPFTSQVSITIALLAVVAAIAGSLENYESASAIIEANKAVLAQEKAADQWSLFESKSLKKNMYVLAADPGGPRAAAYLAKAADEGEGQEKAQSEAKRLEDQRDEAMLASAAHERRHHHLGIAATLLEMAIAISTIAIITHKRWPWLVSAGLGLIGALAAVIAYTPLMGAIPGL